MADVMPSARALNATRLLVDDGEKAFRSFGSLFPDSNLSRRCFSRKENRRILGNRTLTLHLLPFLFTKQFWTELKSSEQQRGPPDHMITGEPHRNPHWNSCVLLWNRSNKQAAGKVENLPFSSFNSRDSCDQLVFFTINGPCGVNSQFPN